MAMTIKDFAQVLEYVYQLGTQSGAMGDRNRYTAYVAGVLQTLRKEYSYDEVIEVKDYDKEPD